MTNLEKLRTATPEQIAEMFCYEYIENCDASLRFIFERYGGGKSGVIEWLNKEAKLKRRKRRELEFMHFDAEEVKDLLAEFIEKHPLVVDHGIEYIMRDWKTQFDALRLVCDIFDNM